MLFASGLLGKIAKDSEVTVTCFFRPAKGRRDTETRNGAMKRLCASLGVDCVQYPFAVEAHHRLLKRFIVLRSEPEEHQGRMVRSIQRHGLYPVLTAAAFAAIRQYEPDIVITHNREGEYGLESMCSCIMRYPTRRAVQGQSFY